MVMFLALIILIIIISRMIKHSRSASGVKSENYISRNTPLGSPITGLNKNADKTISGSSSDLCPHCKGSGKMVCPWCSGFGRRICGSCGGSGQKFVGISRFNPSGIQRCPSCMGGRIPCTCMGGKVICSKCKGKGHIPIAS